MTQNDAERYNSITTLYTMEAKVCVVLLAEAIKTPLPIQGGKTEVPGFGVADDVRNAVISFPLWKFYILHRMLQNKRMWEETMNIKLDANAIMPTRAYPGDAGLDLYSPISTKVPARGNVVIDTGVAVAIPDGYVGLVASKSGLMLKGITSRGVIDSSFRGTIKAVLYNSSGYDYPVAKGDKVTQLIIMPIATPEIVLVDELSDTERGKGGFGSSGR